jgi:hypothetical protein
MPPETASTNGDDAGDPTGEASGSAAEIDPRIRSTMVAVMDRKYSPQQALERQSTAN